MTIKARITEEDVKKMAVLAKLNVEGQEERFAQLFTDTLEKIKILEELDTTKVNETFQVTGLVNVFQDLLDTAACLQKEEVLSLAPDSINGLISTKAVFDR